MAADPNAPTAAPGTDATQLAHTLHSARESGAVASKTLPSGALRYDMAEEIGRGGMGRVFRATDLQFSRSVAIKKLRPEIEGSEVRQRFDAERLIAGNLEHPGIPPVYESGTHDGTPFYAMRLVHGETLAESLASCRDMGQRLALIPALVRVAQTLAYAHSQGVVHRDIKPQNIVVGRFGETFVLDWGIAKVRGMAADSVAGADGGESPGTASGSTVAGSIMGTPAYMAPEQAAGRVDEIDERTDVFALGALLYHVLVGEPPYRDGAFGEIIGRAKTAQFESIESAAPKAPRVLRMICARAMARRPADRFRTATEMATALEAFTSDAVAHEDAGAAGWVTKIITAISLMLAVIAVGATFAMAPSIKGQGYPTLVAVVFAVLGLSLSALEFGSKGRYRLNPLILAVAISTLLVGVLGTMQGEQSVFRFMAELLDQPDAYRKVATHGTIEALSSVSTGASLTILQLIAWAIARRRVLRA